jgi:hypothetical protein
MGAMSRSETGTVGEQECAWQLERLGWNVQRANLIRANFPNIDLFAEKGHLRRAIQVKSSKKERGYITGGGVNLHVVRGGSILNRAQLKEKCQFVIFLATEGGLWRHFVVPVDIAEGIFRRNIDSYFGRPKLNGGARKPNGQADIFVGTGPFAHGRIVPDQRQEVIPYENRWDLLELG